MVDDRQRLRQPSLQDVIRAALRQSKAQDMAALPGKIDKYDAATQKADVKPLLQRPLVDEDGEDLPSEVLPVVPSVPIVFPRADFGGAKFFMSFPLKKGDHVLLVTAKWSLDQWKSKAAGTDVEPVQLRENDLSDVIAIPGLYPFPESLSDVHDDNIVIGRDGGIQIHIKPSDEIHLGSENADQFVALAQKVFDEIDALRSTVNSLVTNFNSHIHITTATVGPTAVPGVIAPTTSQASPPAAVNSVAAAKVKAD